MKPFCTVLTNTLLLVISLFNFTIYFCYVSVANFGPVMYSTHAHRFVCMCNITKILQLKFLVIT